MHMNFIIDHNCKNTNIFFSQVIVWLTECLLKLINLLNNMLLTIYIVFTIISIHKRAEKGHFEVHFKYSLPTNI